MTSRLLRDCARSQPLPQRALCCALVALAGSALMLAGCEQDTPSSAAVAKASQEMQAAGVVAYSPESLVAGIGQNASNAASSAASGTAGEKSSAAILSAQAALALGEKEAQAMSRAEADIRRRLARLNELAGIWALKNSIATTADAFDPAPQLKELAASVSLKNDELLATTAKRDEFKSRIDDVRARSAALLGEAKAFFEQSNSLRQQAAAMSAREGAPLVEQAAATRRQGDAKRLEGEKLAAEGDVLAPQLAEQEALIQKARNQLTKLAEAKKALDDRKAAASKEAADNREQASQINIQLESMYAELVKIQDGEFQSAFDTSKGQFDKALNATRSAADAGGTAKVLAGSAGLSIAGLQATRLQMLSSLASSLDVLVNTQPPLPRRADYLAKRTQLAEESTKLLEDAKATIEAAQSSFAGANVPPDAKEKLQALAQRLKTLPDALEPPPADGIPRGAKKLMSDFLAANRESRFDDVAALFHTTTDEGKALVASQTKLGDLFKKLDDATKAKFEVSFADAIAKAPGGQMVAGMLKQADYSTVSLEQLSFDKQGDNVLVSLPGSPMPLTLLQVDGQWKLSLGPAEAMAAQATPMMNNLVTVVEGLITKVEAGDFATAEDVGNAFMTDMSKAMMGGGGGG